MVDSTVSGRLGHLRMSQDKLWQYWTLLALLGLEEASGRVNEALENISVCSRKFTCICTRPKVFKFMVKLHHKCSCIE